MDSMLEVRWHGRGGQGAVTAAKVLAESVSSDGKYIQAFPEYGPERMGAPVQAFTRISDDPIEIHCQVTDPSVVVVLDATLLKRVDVLAGLPNDGTLIVNTKDTPAAIRERLKAEGRKIYTVDATGISLKCLGRNIPNTPMIGALLKVTRMTKLETVVEDFKKKYARKFRPEIIEGNVKAIEEAYQEVKSE